MNLQLEKIQGYSDILSFWMVCIDFHLCLQMKEAGPRSTGQPNLTTYSSHGPRFPGDVTDLSFSPLVWRSPL